tara:strand:+ start:316 stop:546 length:231 start_codon:yes stop_codon:yes gene_type:complete
MEPTKEMELVDALRYKAFETNLPVDMDAYQSAAIEWFQGEATRRLERSYINEANLRETYEMGFADGTKRQSERTRL